VGGVGGHLLQLDLDARSSNYLNWAVWGLGRSGSDGSIFENVAMGFWVGLALDQVWIGREYTLAIAAQDLNTIRPSYAGGEWYHVRALIDLSANGGDGSGSLFIRDLTDGESNLIPVPMAQNVNLQLLTCPAPNPLLWDTTAVFTLSEYGGNGAVDNVSYSVVPEPSWLAGSGAICMAYLRSMRRPGRSCEN
jgi:hypothetical protein